MSLCKALANRQVSGSSFYKDHIELAFTCMLCKALGCYRECHQRARHIFEVVFLICTTQQLLGLEPPPPHAHTYTELTAEVLNLISGYGLQLKLWLSYVNMQPELKWLDIHTWLNGYELPAAHRQVRNLLSRFSWLETCWLSCLSLEPQTRWWVHTRL